MDSTLRRKGLEAAMGLLTAEEAVELSGFEAELLLIDKEMREQAGKSQRGMWLRVEIAESQLLDVIESLRARGFRVEKKTDPYRVEVTW